MTKKKQGFTIVELIVVIVVVGILITLVALQAGRGRLVARDKERENDVKIITSFLENTYQTGQADGAQVPTGLSNAVSLGYPSTSLISLPSDAQSQAITGAIDPNALKSPSKGASALVAASTNAVLGGGVTIDATAANDVYVYQPLDSAGALCQFATGDVASGTGSSATTGAAGNASQKVIAPRLINNCVKFNLYYFSETANAIQTVPSSNTNSNGL